MIKKGLALILTVALCLGSFNMSKITTYATENNEQIQLENAEINATEQIADDIKNSSTEVPADDSEKTDTAEDNPENIPAESAESEAQNTEEINSEESDSEDSNSEDSNSEEKKSEDSSDIPAESKTILEDAELSETASDIPDKKLDNKEIIDLEELDTLEEKNAKALPSTVEGKLLNMDIVALDGKTYHASSFKEDYIVFIFGSYAGEIRNMVERAAQIRDYGISAKVIYLCTGGSTYFIADEGVTDPDVYVHNVANRYNVLVSNNQDYNNDISNDITFSLTGHYGGFPLTCVLDSNRHLHFSNDDECLYDFTKSFGLDPTIFISDKDELYKDLQELEIMGLDGKKYHVSDFEEDLIALIFGRSTCGNTMRMAYTTNEFIEKGYSIKSVLMDINSKDDGLIDFAEKYNCFPSITENGYNSWKESELHRDIHHGYPKDLLLPLYILINKDRRVIYCNRGYDVNGLSSAISSEKPAVVPVVDPTVTYDLPGITSENNVYPISINYKQTEAREILDMVNNFRTGSDAWIWNSDNSSKTRYSNLKPLKYDYGLEQVAMQRAAEISLLFDHERPNGKKFYSIYVETGKCGENIAFGQKSSNDVFVAWREDNENYSGQGHRRNMLDPEQKYIGIGHAKVNGCDFWVMELNSGTTKQASNSAYNGDMVVDIEVLPKNIKTKEIELLTKEYGLKPGATADLPWIREYLTTNDSYPNSFYISSPKATYSEYDKKIISIDTKSGIIKALKNGNTKIAVTVNGVKDYISVSVSDGVLIRIQPKDAVADLGKRASFYLFADKAKAYQWQYSKDGGKTWINSTSSGFATNSYSVKVENLSYYSYLFRCNITGTDGDVATSNVVKIKSEFSITKQPVDVAATVGEKVSFEVTATGAKSYQWMYTTNNGKTWKSNWASSVSGTTSNKLTLPVKENWLTYKFKCVVTGNDGSTIDSNLVLIKGKPNITKQPSNATGAIGENISFEVTATGAKSYQWMYTTNNGSSWKTNWASSVTGTTSNKLTLPVKENWLTYKFKCVVTGYDGSIINSKNVMMKAAKPTITKQPANASAAVGKKISFEVTATGAKGYQWMYTTNNGSSWKTNWASSVTGTTSNKLTLPVKESWLTYKFKCVVTGYDGSTLSSKNVIMKAKPTITKQPTNVTANAGETVTLGVTATGVKNYQWMFSTNNGKTWKTSWASTVTGTTTNKLTMKLKSGWLNYQFKCVITGNDGSTIDSNVVLIKPKLVITTQPKETAALVGETAVFTVAATGATSYQWEYSEDSGRCWSIANFSGAKTNKLSVKVKDDYYYGYLFRCVVKNSDGKILTSKEVSIIDYYLIQKQPVSVTASIGDTVSFKIKTKGYEFCSWHYKKDSRSSWSQIVWIDDIEGEFTDTLTVHVTAANANYEYYCSVYSSEKDKTESSDIVRVNLKKKGQ